MVTTRGKQSKTASVPVTLSQDTQGEALIGATINPSKFPVWIQYLSKDEPSAAQVVLSTNENLETVGSRLRKRRRVDSGNQETHIQPKKRSTRRKNPGAPEDTIPNDDPTFDGSGDPRDSLEQAHVDPRLSDNASRTSRGTNTDPEPSMAAGITIPRSRGAPEANMNSNNLDSDAILNDIGGEARQSFIASAAPDLSTVIESIIKHGETIDEHYATKGLNEVGIVDTESFVQLGASAHLKFQSLPILDNLSVQILNVLAKSTYREIISIIEDPESEAGQAYATLKSLFDHTKKVYSVHEPFLSAQELGLSDRVHVETVRKANLATFVSSVFGGQDVGFYHLNEYFLDTFVGAGGRLLKSQAQLFLDLKTQAFISARSYGQRPKEELLDDIFPADMEERLLARKGSPTFGSRLLAPSETDFLQRARNRSQALLRDPTFQDVDALSRRYAWEDFLRDISNYVSKNFESLLGQPMLKTGPPSRMANYFVPPQIHDTQHTQHVEQQNSRQRSPQQDIVNDSNSQNHTIATPPDVIANAARVADADMHGFGFHQGISLGDTNDAQSQPQSINQDHMQLQPHASEINNEEAHGLPAPQDSMQYQYPPPPPHVFYNNGSFPTDQNLQPQFNNVPVNMNLQQQFYGDQPVNPHPTQSAPTQVLYERARQAATAKASPSSRRAGHPSQRRPWSNEEENALMAGLDRVKGPHWSQILAMFGPGGTINETLKDRNQVQLKDKARNLKLFFLKSGIEVPYYLQFVTGELKTRAPGQAARNEAKERENDSEERAHVEGVFALAYGPDSIQDSENGVSLHASAGPSNHSSAQFGNENQEVTKREAQAHTTNQNEISVQLANAAQELSQPPHAPEANMINYNPENPVTPNFQAMVDLAVAEAARVSSGGG